MVTISSRCWGSRKLWAGAAKAFGSWAMLLGSTGRFDEAMVG